MQNGKGRFAARIVPALLAALALLALGGCREAPVEPEPIAGGVTDKTDTNAPRTIRSKDISDFYATFCLQGEWSPGRETVFYTFEVKPDDAGTLTATEAASGVSAPADGALLTALQEVVDAHRLAGMNGEYRTTAGLPPEFWPCTLRVNYASGEMLTFTHNNDPDAAWAKELYLAFADWFAARGIDALLPPETVTGRVTHVQVIFRDVRAERTYVYFIEPEEDGRYRLERMVGDGQDSTLLPDTEAFLAGVDRIIAGFDLRPYDAYSALYGYERTEEDEKDPFSADLELVFWFDDREQLAIHTSAQSAIDDLSPLLTELFSYFDSFFPIT